MRILTPLTRSRHLTAFRRVAGPFVAAGRYPFMRWISRRSYTELNAPSIPAPTLNVFDGVQLPSSGCGPGMHRRYRIDIEGATMTPSQLMAAFVANPNSFSPVEFATFGEIRDPSDTRPLAVGEDVMVRLSGPYDAPVRVVEIADDTVRLQTRDGHIEAGQIQFAARMEGSMLRFDINSWARNAGIDIHILWWTGLAYELQTIMWTHVCRRAAAVSGGQGGPVHVRTETISGEDVALLGEVVGDAGRPDPMRMAITFPESETAPA